MAQLVGILERTKAAPLSDTDYATLKMAIDTLSFLTQELAAKGATIDRLRRMLFGASTEKTSRVLGDPAANGPEGAAATGSSSGGAASDAGEPKPKAPGHGRNGAAAYPGAKKIRVPHATMKHGDGCPGCQTGKVYPLAEPAVLVRVQGMAPLGATLYEKDRWRCNLCGEVYTAASPPGVGDEKYDETAAAMIGLLKYGAGLPFNRIQKLQAGLGIPLPAATQWDVVEDAAQLLAPAHEELIDRVWTAAGSSIRHVGGIAASEV